MEVVKMTNKNPQTEANKRWQQQNKERAKYLSNRSRARSFIRNQAELEDLEELQQLIKEREVNLKG
jgi:ribosomal protein S20